MAASWPNLSRPLKSCSGTKTHRMFGSATRQVGADCRCSRFRPPVVLCYLRLFFCLTQESCSMLEDPMPRARVGRVSGIPAWDSAVLSHIFWRMRSARLIGAVFSRSETMQYLHHSRFMTHQYLSLISQSLTYRFHRGRQFEFVFSAGGGFAYESNSHQIGTESIPVAEMGIVRSALRANRVPIS